jgi:hypothetical protein
MQHCKVAPKGKHDIEQNKQHEVERQEATGKRKVVTLMGKRYRLIWLSNLLLFSIRFTLFIIY